MPLQQRFDRLLLAATVVQTVVGLALLASASWLIATERYHRPGTYFFTWQAATAVIGLVLLVAGMHLRLRLLDDRRVVWGAMILVWGLLVLALLQPPVANAHRWVGLGALSLQPSVLARPAMILLAAVLLPVAAREGWPLRRLLPLAAAGGITAALILFEPDLGSASLVVILLLGMAFVAGIRMRLLAVPMLAALVFAVVAVVLSPYRLERVRAFVNPEAGSAASWQTRQSLIALGSGGLFGEGYGAGLQKLFFLPEPHTDFIFSITGEELGLAGVGGLLLLVATVTWRGLRIGAGQARPEHALLAFGLTLAYGAQSLIHMAVCLGLAPPKGIPLPLVSYGKTDLLVTLGCVGLLLNLSREVRP